MVEIFKDFNLVKNLWLRLQCKTPFQTFEWNSLFWQYLKGNKKLFILCTDNTILPLQLRMISEFKVLELVGTRGTDYLDFIGSSEDLGELIAFLSSNKFWDIIHFEDIPEDSELCKINSRFYTETSINVPCFAVPLPAKQSSRVNKEISYYNRKLKRKFKNTRFIFKDDICKIENYFDVHQQRQISQKNKGTFYLNETRDFVRQFLQEFFAKDLLYLTGLYIDNKLSSSIISCLWKNKIFALYVGFLSKYAKYRIGTILNNYALQQAVKKGVKEYDLSRGKEYYKKRLGGIQKNNLLIEIYRNKKQIQKYKKLRSELFKNIGYSPVSF